MSINWATVAPESRLFKSNKELFKWDDSPGLEHHCGTCQTPLHNSRAKTSCIGKHVEPCYRYHQQLHFMGKSHECFGCNSSDEMHHQRHKEIVRITRQINAMDDASALQSNRRGPKKRRESTATLSTNTPTDASSDTFTAEQKLKRKERKKGRKSGSELVKDQRIVEAFPREDLDFVSEAIHLTIHESKGAWWGTHDKDDSLENDEEAIEDDEYGEYVEFGDAYSVKAPYEMTPRQRKTTKKFNNPINHSSFGGGSRKYTPHRGMVSDLYDGVDPKIFSRLGIEIVNPSADSKSRRDLVANLVAAVKEDLGIIQREEVESEMRQEGFERWAGKTGVANLARNREEIDWRTGQKKGTERKEPFAAKNKAVAEGFENVEKTEQAVVETSAKEPAVIKIVVPKAPSKTVRRAKPIRDDDDSELAVEMKIGKTYAMVVKVLAPEPAPNISFTPEEAMGWETVSHKKSTSKTTSHKRVGSKQVTVR